MGKLDKKIQGIRQWNETQKNTVKKLEDTGLNISVETSIYDHIDYLLQQIEIKDKALEFYANVQNYDVGPAGRIEDTVGTQPFESWVNEDSGKHARAALKGEDTSE